jgi:hypothetical protein
MTVTVCLPATELISIDAMASVDTVLWWCRLCNHHGTATTRPTAHSDGIEHLSAEHHRPRISSGRPTGLSECAPEHSPDSRRPPGSTTVKFSRPVSREPADEKSCPGCGQIDGVVRTSSTPRVAAWKCTRCAMSRF